MINRKNTFLILLTLIAIPALLLLPSNHAKNIEKPENKRLVEIIDDLEKSKSKPQKRGYENGIDISGVFENHIKNGTNFGELKKQLESGGFNITENLDGGKNQTARAVYVYYTKGIVKKPEFIILIKISLSNNHISGYKAVYFRDIHENLNIFSSTLH